MDYNSDSDESVDVEDSSESDKKRRLQIGKQHNTYLCSQQKGLRNIKSISSNNIHTSTSNKKEIQFSTKGKGHSSKRSAQRYNRYDKGCDEDEEYKSLASDHKLAVS